MDKYDIIIVGAGPAGLTAAKVLAENNKKVLVLEKDKEIGEKVCAGGLTKKDFRELKIPKWVTEQEFCSVTIRIYDHLIKIQADEPFVWTCDRKKLLRWQFGLTQKAGADIWLNSKVVGISDDYVSLNNGKRVYFKYLVGADGSNSIVRNSFGLKSKKIVLAIQYISKAKFNELQIFLDPKRFGSCYAWIFPHQDYTSIGVSADPRLFKINILRKNFERWCKELPFNIDKAKLQTALINYDYQGVEFGNKFLIGDAAGLASGLTGEGMHPAMISGIEIAKKIIDPNYKFKKLQEILKAKEQEEKIVSLYKNCKIVTYLGFRLLTLLLKSRLFKKNLIKFFTEK